MSSGICAGADRKMRLNGSGSLGFDTVIGNSFGAVRKSRINIGPASGGKLLEFLPAVICSSHQHCNLLPGAVETETIVELVTSQENRVGSLTTR